MAETAIESLAGYAYDDKHNGKHTDGKHDDLYPHGTKHTKHDKDATFAYQIVQTDRTFTYDDVGKLLSATETEDNYGTYVYTYEYDLMGNRTAVYKIDSEGEVVESEEYSYNESNQVIKVALYDGKKNTTITYTYDEDGNRISETGKIGTDKVEKYYEYTVENRLAAVYDADELLMAAAYDGDGNRVFQLNYNLHTDEDWKGNSGNVNGNNKDNTGSGNNGKGSSKNSKGNSKSEGTDDAGYGNATNAEENNSQNQSGILFPIEAEVSETEQSLIDLIKTTGKQKNYELIEYLNDVNREYVEVLVEQNIKDKTDTSYVYGVDRLSLDRFNGSTGYYLYDPRGSVSGITNEEGQVYQSYRYSVTGEITFGAPQYENEYTYNGESYNPNIESQYLRARYYCVVTANFLTEDSYLGDITEPLTLNRYNYCVSNPLNHVDPSGNIELDIPYSEIEEAETFGEMWDLIYKYAMIEFTEIEEAHESRKEEYMKDFNASFETPFMQGVMEVESSIGISGVYNLLMSPLRYSIQGEAHPFLETVNNRQENSKYFYGGVAELAFEVSDSLKNSEQITARIYGTIFTVIENPGLLTPDLMGRALDGWDFIWESSDKEFFSTSGRGFMEVASAITGAHTVKCLDEFAKGRLRSGKLIATSGSTKVVKEVSESAIKGGSGIDFDLTKLSRSQQKAIESADNIINDHLKSSDLSAALGDLQGNPIAKPNGGYWNHAQEVKDAYTGLVRAEKTLAGSLQNPNLAPDVRAFIQGKYDSIISYMTTIEEMFAPYGGIN